jgi:hypothetical protein
MRPPSGAQRGVVTMHKVGGLSLAAALAAGETPSPEMVAASGESEGLYASRGPSPTPPSKFPTIDQDFA